MAMPILTTKLYIPPVRQVLVSRPQLIERLNAGLRCKLTLISAPAGFGKTTLLSEWVHSPGRSLACPYVAWLSLDKADNDPTRFWVYVIAALQTIRQDLGVAALAALQSSQPPAMEALLTGLINDIADLGSVPLALVLDDLHLVEAPPVYAALNFLVDHLPPSMRLILSGRADPPWPLARLRAKGEMLELRADDLRFTFAEVAAFLNDVMGLGLSAADMAILNERTEGWIVGLQMAALSMHGREDAPAFIRSFHGSHRFILDYLVEEVLDRQPADVRDFLHQTAVLDRMTASLCDAVTGRQDSQAVLTQLEQGNLFLVPLDDERHWYRYHSLFADLLRIRLQGGQPAQVQALHRQAGLWYEQQGLVAEAVSHALSAGDIQLVIPLVEKNAMSLLELGEMATVLGWLHALPDGVEQAHPWLLIAHAWALIYAGEQAGIEPLLRAVERVLPGCGDASQTEGEALRMAAHVQSIRAYATAFAGDMGRAAKLARDALDLLPRENSPVRCFTAGFLASMLRRTGRLAEAAQVQAEAIAISQAMENSHLAVTAMCNLAILQRIQGRRREEIETVRRALQWAEQQAVRGGRLPMPSAAFAYVCMADIYYEQNELALALRYAREGVDLAKQWGMPDALGGAYFRLAGVYQAVGDVERLQETLQAADRLAEEIASPYAIRLTAAVKAGLLLALGDLTAAVRWAEESGLGFDDEPSFEQRVFYVTLARVLIARGRHEPEGPWAHRALVLLERLLTLFEEIGARGLIVENLVLQALALQAQGKPAQAVESLERVLTAAEPEGYVRTFIDQGVPMGDLLAAVLAARQAARQSHLALYASRLVSALGGHKPAEKPIAPPSSALAEPLSAQEMKVLRLLASTLSTPEIARELVVSANTVRSHVKSIYGKLNVHGRIEAVQRAKELGLWL